MVIKKLISICIPCYNEEENVIPAYQVIIKNTTSLKRLNFEFIFVDNGSQDKTREKILQIAKKDKRVKGIFLSRNFGPESSGQAAFDHVTGDAVIGIPADMQEPPEMIPKLIKKWEEGYDLVLGVYRDTADNFLMKVIRRIFYRILKEMTYVDIPIDSTGFGIFNRRVLDALKTLKERHRFARGLLAWVGFKRAFIPYVRRKRTRGKSSYNIFEYIRHAEKGIFGFSYLLLDVMVYLGFFLVFLSFLFIVGYLFTVIYFGNPINASIPLMLVIVFFGGVQLLAISIIGKYIQVIVEETKARPAYIIKDTVNIF